MAETMQCKRVVVCSDSILNQQTLEEAEYVKQLDSEGVNTQNMGADKDVSEERITVIYRAVIPAFVRNRTTSHGVSPQSSHAGPR